jgi:Aspartyl protease
MLKLRIGKSEALWFTLDSGARHTVIDPVTARTLSLHVMSAGATSGTGKGTVELRHAAPVALTLAPNVVVRDSDPWVIDLSKIPLPKRSAGLLGVQFFEQYVVRIDDAHQVLSVYDKRDGPRVALGNTLMLTERDHRLFIPVGIGVKGVRHEVQARVDTGSGDSVSSPLVRYAQEQRRTTLGNGLGHDFEGTSGVYDFITIGPSRITHVWGPWSERPAIGMEILRRFVMTFDVPHGRLYLQPTDALSEPVPSPA